LDEAAAIDSVCQLGCAHWEFPLERLPEFGRAFELLQAAPVALGNPLTAGPAR
jgi:hypothetical protein